MNRAENMLDIVFGLGGVHQEPEKGGPHGWGGYLQYDSEPLRKETLGGGRNVPKQEKEDENQGCFLGWQNQCVWLRVKKKLLDRKNAEPGLKMKTIPQKK